MWRLVGLVSVGLRSLVRMLERHRSSVGPRLRSIGLLRRSNKAHWSLPIHVLRLSLPRWRVCVGVQSVLSSCWRPCQQRHCHRCPHWEGWLEYRRHRRRRSQHPCRSLHPVACQQAVQQQLPVGSLCLAWLGLALAEVCLASLLPFVLLWFCFLLFLVLLLFVLAFAAASSSSPSSDALRPRDRERECCVARARPRPRCLELARLTSSDGLYSLSDVPSLHGTGCAVFLAFVRVVALARVMLVRSSPSVLVLLSSSLAAAAAARCWALVRTVGRSLVALSGSELRVSLLGGLDGSVSATMSKGY